MVINDNSNIKMKGKYYSVQKMIVIQSVIVRTKDTNLLVPI